MRNKGTFQEYTTHFVQRVPRYSIRKNNRWRTVNKPLPDGVITNHLDQRYTVGVLGKWYPGYCIIDFDDVNLNYVDEIRDKLCLNDSNSMLCSSESKDSYHLLLRPVYNGEPPTIKLLQKVFQPFAKLNQIEIYPQKRRVVRLPFGKYQGCVNFEFQHLSTWEEQLYWFEKLDEFDLRNVKHHQTELNLISPASGKRLSLSAFQIGKEFLETGLVQPSSRNEAQFAVIYYLWRLNMPMDEAERITFSWIKKMHNGFSKTINSRNFKIVREEISRQANRVYANYDLSQTYPDTTHNSHGGFLAKDDIPEIIQITKGSLPRMRYLFNIVKYAYPRRHRNFLNIHSGKLVKWSSHRTYNKYLNELDAKGIAKRGDTYSADRFSKSIDLKWKFKSSDEAILYEGRSIETFEETIRLLFNPRNFRDLLQQTGTTKQNISRIVKLFYDPLSPERSTNG